MKENNSSITLNVQYDTQNTPEHIDWKYTEKKPTKTDAFLLAIWDKNTQKSLHIDIWTKDMTKDEMHHFIFQTMNTMADTYSRATGNTALADKMKQVCNDLEKELTLGL